MLHPWLGMFYRVRVPVVVTESHGKGAPRGEGNEGSNGDAQAAHDAFSYRQECFRRPWAYFSEDGFGVKADEDGGGHDRNHDSDSSSASQHLRRDSGSTREAVLHAVLIMHAHVKASSVVALMHDVRRKIAKGTMVVALTVVP